VFTADAGADANTYVVDDSSLDENGNPLVVFRGASAAGGRLQAGPGNFQFALPVQDMDLVLNLTNAAITGALAVNDAGLTIDGGVISGQISQADLDAALVVVPEDLRGLIPIFLQADIDSDGNGSNDSYSLCLTFEADPATLQGYPVQ
jgi:hypothetical protein